MNSAVAEIIYGLSFYACAGLAIFSALWVAFLSRQNPVRGALWLVVCFVSVAGIYVLLKAPFLAMVQILVYAGAVMVLFVMIIMLLDLGKMEPGARGQAGIRFLGVIIGLLIMGILGITLAQAWKVGWKGFGEAEIGGSEKIGEVLFTKYLLPFEVLSLLLLVAVISAIYLARRWEEKK